jgi:hypothetical protein
MSIDDTTALPIVPTALKAITAASEESETEALIDELTDRLSGVRVLAPSRADETARAALREEIARMVATAQQLDAHLTAGDWADRDAATSPQFQDWLTAPGGTK